MRIWNSDGATSFVLHMLGGEYTAAIARGVEPILLIHRDASEG